MNRADVAELHYITGIANVPSILTLGILSHKKAQTIPHISVAMQAVQNIRADKPVPPGNQTIHCFANLYFDARNPMMSVRRQHHENLCVLRVSHAVLDLPGVRLTDQNAASNYVRFYPSPTGLAFLDGDIIFALDWTHSNQIEYWRRKSGRCAEALVPEQVDPAYITGAYVSGPTGQAALQAMAPTLTITINPPMSFQE